MAITNHNYNSSYKKKKKNRKWKDLRTEIEWNYGADENGEIKEKVWNMRQMLYV